MYDVRPNIGKSVGRLDGFCRSPATTMARPSTGAPPCTLPWPIRAVRAAVALGSMAWGRPFVSDIELAMDASLLRSHLGQHVHDLSHFTMGMVGKQWSRGPR